MKENVPSNINVRDALLKFHKEYYSPTIMKLAVLGKENIDDLEKMVISKFSDIPNLNNRGPPIYSKDVFPDDRFPLITKIVPLKDLRQLQVFAILPIHCLDTFLPIFLSKNSPLF